MPLTHIGDNDESCNQGDDADRDVDVEDPAPVDVSDDGAAQGGSSHCRETSHCSPYAKCSTATLGGEKSCDDGKRLWSQQRATDALQNTRCDQLIRILREAAQRRRDAEDEKAYRE